MNAWRVVLAGVAALSLSLPALAQQSAGWRITDAVIQAAGRPLQGVTASSSRARLSLESVGAPSAALGLASASFRLDAGFASAYAPPGEVDGLVFASKSLLRWPSEGASVLYDVYRGPISDLSTSGGECLAPSLPVTELDDPGPPPGDAAFYLVTGVNRLGEEGILGSRSSGETRPNTAPCP